MNPSVPNGAHVFLSVPDATAFALPEHVLEVSNLLMAQLFPLQLTKLVLPSDACTHLSLASGTLPSCSEHDESE